MTAVRWYPFNCQLPFNPTGSHALVPPGGQPSGIMPLGNTSPGIMATTAPGTELQRSHIRSGPLQCRRTIFDDLMFLPDGSLIRSHRLARLEAALLISNTPQNPKRLVQLARLIDVREVRQLIHVLNDSYDRERCAFRIESTAGGFQMLTRPQLSPWMDRLHQRQDQMKLTPPAMETLTIIAYQQPVTRADVEAIRGVQSTDMIKQLIDRGLVRIGGEDDSLGRPFLYETTRQFLNMFGLQNLTDLPDYASLRRQSVTDLASDTEVEGDNEAEVPASESHDDTGESPDAVEASDETSPSASTTSSASTTREHGRINRPGSAA